MQDAAELESWSRDLCDALAGKPFERAYSFLDCLDYANARAPVGSFRAAVTAVRDEVARGESLSAAMRRREDAFPEPYVTTVRYGEIYGEVDIALRRYVNRPAERFRPCALTERRHTGVQPIPGSQRVREPGSQHE